MSTAIKDAAEVESRSAERAVAPKREVSVQPTAPQVPSPAPAFVLPRTTNPIAKLFYKGPNLMWRLGLGRVLGPFVLILTTTGRKSGLPRHTPLGYSRLNGRKYVFTLRGPETDWYRNLTANPHVAIQSSDGTDPVLARRVTGDEEIAAAYEFLAPNPVMKQWADALGIEFTRAELIAHKDDFILITFDPTTEPTPPALRADLVWVWGALANVITMGSLILLLSARARKRARARRGK